MKTVNKTCLPKINCWAYKNGKCSILTETYCEHRPTCGHYRTKAQFEASVEKSNKRLKCLGIKK